MTLSGPQGVAASGIGLGRLESASALSDAVTRLADAITKELERRLAAVAERHGWLTPEQARDGGLQLQRDARGRQRIAVNGHAESGWLSMRTSVDGEVMRVELVEEAV